MISWELLVKCDEVEMLSFTALIHSKTVGFISHIRVIFQKTENHFMHYFNCWFNILTQFLSDPKDSQNIVIYNYVEASLWRLVGAIQAIYTHITM